RSPGGRQRPEGRRRPVRDFGGLRELQRRRGIAGDEKKRKDTKEPDGTDHGGRLPSRPKSATHFCEMRFPQSDPGGGPESLGREACKIGAGGGWAEAP